MQPLISHLTAREILDSRGYPTVECSCHLTNGEYSTASVPSGASTGTHEAVELRDQNPSYYSGKGVKQAINNIITELSPSVAGDDPTNQTKADRQLISVDGTPNKARMGANAILAASIAIAKAGAKVKQVPLFQHLADCAGNDHSLSIPVPIFNILNGGLHAGMNLDFQEFIVVPNADQIPDYPSQLHFGVQVSHQLKQELETLHLATTVGDEGGYAPLLQSNRAAITLIEKACDAVGYPFSQSAYISFDFAANTFFHNHHYYLKDSRNPFNPTEYAAFLKTLIADFKPLSFEDPFPEDDWHSWQSFTKDHGHEVILVGDDLLVTNPTRLEQAIQTKSCNAILVKPNQIGSVTEAIEVVNLAKKYHFKTIASHRSGETTDAFIADFAVATGTDFVKFGAPMRGERVVKYNRLLAIDKLLHP